MDLGRRQRAALYAVHAHGRNRGGRAVARRHRHERHLGRARPIQTAVREHAAGVAVFVAGGVAHLHRVVAAGPARVLDEDVGRAHGIVRIVDLEAMERRVRIEVEAQGETVARLRTGLQVRRGAQSLRGDGPHGTETVGRRRAVEPQRLDELEVDGASIALCVRKFIRIVAAKHVHGHVAVEPGAVRGAETVGTCGKVHLQALRAPGDGLFPRRHDGAGGVAETPVELREVASSRTCRLRLDHGVLAGDGPHARCGDFNDFLPTVEFANLLTRERRGVDAQVVDETVELVALPAATHAERLKDLAAERQQLALRRKRLLHRRRTVARSARGASVDEDPRAGLIPRHGEVGPVVLEGAAPRAVGVVVVAHVRAQLRTVEPEPELSAPDALAGRCRVREEVTPDFAPLRVAPLVGPLALEPEAHGAAFGHEVAGRGVCERGLRGAREAHGLAALALGVGEMLGAHGRGHALGELRVGRAVERRVEEQLRRDDGLFGAARQFRDEAVARAVERDGAANILHVPAQVQGFQVGIDELHHRERTRTALHGDVAALVVVAGAVSLEVHAHLRRSVGAEGVLERAVLSAPGLEADVRAREHELDHPGVKRGARVDHEPVGGVGDDELRGEVAALGVEGENLLSGGVDHAHAARVAHDAHVAPRAGRELHDLRGRCHGKASGETGGKGG